MPGVTVFRCYSRIGHETIMYENLGRGSKFSIITEIEHKLYDMKRFKKKWGNCFI